MSRFLGGRWAVRGVGVIGAVLLAMTGTVVGAAAVPAAAAPAGPVVGGGINPSDFSATDIFILQMDGTSVEFLHEVSGLDVANHRVTLVRAAFHSAAVDRWIDDAIAGREGRLKSITVGVPDSSGRIVKRYNFGGAFVERIDLHPGSQADALTVRYFTLNVV
ncbi:hypothetical protein [Kitasatospora sp. NPDC050543]|uniref:hypothetical protein n=1 Tax=Kitasatospora sp. NPDC050543 TaxID=3364054 RepID=UPI0037A8A09B